jgi:spermidine synthase
VFGFTSIAHENNLGATASLISGDTAIQYGVIIGLTILGMAVGFGITSKVTDLRIIEWFLRSEILLTILSGFSVVMAMWSYTNLPLLYNFFIWGEMFVIAVLVGVEDALILRIASEYQKSLRLSVAIALGLSNVGGGIGGAIFGTVLIPTFGEYSLALVLGILDGAFVLLNILYFRSSLKYVKSMLVVMVLVLTGLIISFFNSNTIAALQMQTLYNDPIVMQWEGPYGVKTLTHGPDYYKFFINGQIQFSTKDEYQYHQPLIHPALSLASQRVQTRPLNVLMAGGGDGFAAREILKYPNVGRLTIVDIDKQMTDDVARSEPIARFNGNSLSDPRVHIINKDAYVWMRDQVDMPYDVVIVDLVDPDTETTAKLYSLEFYKAVQHRVLGKGGIFVTQSTSPWYSPKAFWTVNLTLERSFSHVTPYRWNVPSFGDWGWNIASDEPFDMTHLAIDTSKTSYSTLEGAKGTWLTTEGLRAMLFFAPSEWEVRKELKAKGIVSTVLNHAVTIFYKEAGSFEDWGDE